MNIIFQKKCPACGILRKNHTIRMRESCGRVLSKLPLAAKDRVQIYKDWKKNR